MYNYTSVYALLCLVHCYLAHASEPGCVIGFDVHVCIHIIIANNGSDLPPIRSNGHVWQNKQHQHWPRLCVGLPMLQFLHN